MSRRRQNLRNRPTFADMAKGFGSVDAMLLRMADGWIHTVQGNPVFFDRPTATWYEIAPAMAGWVALWERISERYRLGLDLTPISKLCAKLHHGSPITPEEVARCAEIVKTCKRHYRTMDVYEVRSIVNTQLIANNVELRGWTSADHGQAA